jgi:predicted ATPase
MAGVFVIKPVNINYINLLLYRPIFVFKLQYCNYSDQATDFKNPLEVLKRKIQKGELMNDEYQLKIAEDLETVYQDVKQYVPEKPSIFTKWIGKSKKKKKAPKGLYLYGAVGGGKTMLMDLFYNCCQVSEFSVSRVL